MGNQKSIPKRDSSASTPPSNQKFSGGTTLNKYYLETIEELNRKRAEVDDLKCENEKLKDALERISMQTNDKHEEEIDRLTKIHDTKQSKLQAEINGLKSAVTSLQKSVKESDLVKAQSKSGYDAHISQIKTHYEFQKAELNSRINNLNTRIASLEKAVADSNKITSQMKAEKFQLRTQINQMKVSNDSHKKNEMILKLQAECGKLQETIKKIKEEKAKLVDPRRICVIDDVVDCGVINYERLTGKILMVEKLVSDGSTWKADDTEISFESANFQLFIQKELIATHVNRSAMLTRVLYSTITKLHLADIGISYNGYKKMVESGNIHELILHRILVKDEHDIEMGVAELLKEVPNVEKFEYIFKDGEVTLETAEKLSQLRPLVKLQEFSLSEIQENFDFVVFGQFVKKNPSATYHLSFRCSPKYYAKITNVEKDIAKILPSPAHLRIVQLK